MAAHPAHAPALILHTFLDGHCPAWHALSTLQSTPSAPASEKDVARDVLCCCNVPLTLLWPVLPHEWTQHFPVPPCTHVACSNRLSYPTIFIHSCQACKLQDRTVPEPALRMNMQQCRCVCMCTHATSLIMQKKWPCLTWHCRLPAAAPPPPACAVAAHCGLVQVSLLHHLLTGLPQWPSQYAEPACNRSDPITRGGEGDLGAGSACQPVSTEREMSSERPSL